MRTRKLFRRCLSSACNEIGSSGRTTRFGLNINFVQRLLFSIVRNRILNLIMKRRHENVRRCFSSAGTLYFRGSRAHISVVSPLILYSIRDGRVNKIKTSRRFFGRTNYYYQNFCFFFLFSHHGRSRGSVATVYHSIRRKSLG